MTVLTNEQLHVRKMTREELDLCLGWAAELGWNPGLHDAEAFWAADPDGYVVAEYGGEIIGTGAIIAYGRHVGAMGLFIVREDHRGGGLGRELWYKRKEMLQSRLDPGASIGMDGVVAMQPFYAKGGFEFAHTVARHQGNFPSLIPTEGTVDLATVPFEQVAAFDLAHFGAPRDSFLKIWNQPREGAARAILDNQGTLRAVGVIRRSTDGYRIGPLFAQTPEQAETLFLDLASHAQGAPVFLDVPTVNEPAIAMATRHGMVEVFACGRMYLGTPPPLPWKEIYGVTSLELG